MKEVAPWEPDVTQDGSFVEEDNNFVGLFDEGEGESFGLNSDKENAEHDQNREDVNVNEVNSKPDFIQEVENINAAGNDEIGNNNSFHNVHVQPMGVFGIREGRTPLNTPRSGGV